MMRLAVRTVFKSLRDWVRAQRSNLPGVNFSLRKEIQTQRKCRGLPRAGTLAMTEILIRNDGSMDAK